MNTIFRPLLTMIAAAVVAVPAGRGDIFDLFRLKPAPGATSSVPVAGALAGLTQEQVAQGLKEALAKGVQQAVTSLSRPDGFLTNINVKIPMPASLRRAEKILRTLRQDKLADEFVTTMNRAAERAVPEAASVLGDSIKQMTIADAKTILTGTNNAATQYFRRTSETNLFARFRPIVEQATEQVGVTRAYKQMMSKVNFGGVGSALFSQETIDLDSYVTSKALDGLFFKIGEEEKLIRENPVARTTDLLKKVFGAVVK